MLDYLYMQGAEEQVIVDLLKELEEGYHRLEENPEMYPRSDHPKLATAGCL